MAVVAFCSRIFCRSQEAAQEVARALKVPVRADQDLIGRAAQMSGMEEGKLREAMFGRASSREREKKLRGRAVPRLRLAMAGFLEEPGGLVYQGLGSHLIPKGITHVLQVCFMAGEEYRMARAGERGIPREEARERIRESDLAARGWLEYLHGAGAWREEHYDIRSSIDKKSFKATVELIVESAGSQPLRPTEGSLRAVEKLALRGGIEAALAREGYYYPEFKVEAHRNGVTVEINKRVLRLEKLKKELTDIIRTEAGDVPVETGVGPEFHRADIYRQTSFQLPGKVLLVDDERDYVETLSERLRLRDVGASVVYDGEQALAAVREDEPEVMVLDLRMPGVDGTEVLERIKADHPAVEVIVLTGHGSPQDREECLRLGAFAFLQKPVDLEDLSQVMAQALARRRGRDGSGGE